MTKTALRVFAAGGQFPGRETGRAEETSPPAPGNYPDNFVVKSCPTCGTVTDIDYGLANEPAITLAIQTGALDDGYEAALDRLVVELQKRGARERIYLLARSRLRDGYEQHGDAMFGWDKYRRRREIDEELADALNYAISGDVP